MKKKRGLPRYYIINPWLQPYRKGKLKRTSFNGYSMNIYGFQFTMTEFRATPNEKCLHRQSVIIAIAMLPNFPSYPQPSQVPVTVGFCKKQPPLPPYDRQFIIATLRDLVVAPHHGCLRHSPMPFFSLSSSLGTMPESSHLIFFNA